MDARLETVQEVILLAELEVFPEELEGPLSANSVRKPALRHQATSSRTQYAIRSPDRDGLGRRLAASGIPTAVYYPRSLPRQAVRRDFPVAQGGCPVTERIAAEVLSPPMHPGVDRATQERVAIAVCTSSAAAGEC
jgi:dTDP-4-amino-4,6-dideoxygalactose transaminase